MKLNRRQFTILLCLSLLILYGVKAFLIPGLYTSHDGETHTARLANYFLALKEGQLPPALAPTLFGGFGFPIFIFIYPLPYFLGAMVHLVGFSYTDSTEIIMALGHFLSGLFFYQFLKLETKKTLPSFLGALFFTWAPYRFSMLFVRGAFAESFSYLFVAASFYYLHRLITKPQAPILGCTSLSLAGLLLSHQLTSVMFLPLMAWYVIGKATFHPKPVKTLLFPVVSLFIASLIASFIYFPAFLERKYLRFDELINYSLDHFVTIKQLIHSPWSYGFSHPGTINDDMSFQIGLTHLAAVFFALVVIFFALINHKKILPHSDIWWLFWWLIPFFLSSALMLESPLNRWLWTHLPGLNFLDFPWRFLGITITSAALISSYLVKAKTNLFLYLFLLSFVFYANRNHLRINEPVLLDDQFFENYPATATWRNEFLPKTRATNKWVGVHQDYQILSGQATINPIIDTTTNISLEIVASSQSTILIHRLYFPGWQFFLDNQSLAFGSDQVSLSSGVDLKTDIDYSGFIQINVPLGKHLLTARFTPTPIRKVGYIFSLAGLVISLGLIIHPKISSNPYSKFLNLKF